MKTPFSTQRFFGTALLLMGFFILSGFCQTAYADIPIAQVVWVKGTVTAVAQDNKERALKRSDYVYEHETLKTDSKSTGQVVFSDSGLLSLKADTVFKIDEYKYSKKAPASDNKFVGNLVKGGFRQLTGAITKEKPENYQVKTPVATIGVRGTEVDAQFNGTQLIVNAVLGHAFVRNDQGIAEITAKATPFATIQNRATAPVTSVTPPKGYVSAPPLTPAEPSKALAKAANAPVGASSISGGGASSGGATTTTSTGGTSSSGSSGSSEKKAPSGGGVGGCGDLNIGG